MSISSPTRSSIKKAILFGFCVALFILGCHRGAPAQLVVYVTGDSLGYLEPCGCRKDQAGGLPGRAVLVRQTPADRRLVFDVGNVTSGTRDYELLKMKYMVAGMADIGYDAVNLGKKEAELSLDQLQGVLQAQKLPFVSANVVAKKGGAPVTEQFRIVNRGGARIGVIGVTNCPPEDVGPGVEVRPAVETLAQVIPQVKSQCDYLVVLAFTDEDTIADIANKFNEVDCILGGDVQQSSASVANVNRAAVFNVTDKGKVVGRLDLTHSSTGYSVAQAQAIKVGTDKLVPPADIAKLLAGFKGELRDRRYELASVEGMDRIEPSIGTANEFVGDRACLSCHPAAHSTWQLSAHSHAFATLKRVNSEYDPDCLRCHTVGYGLSSGFIDDIKTPTLENVQCESCHGRGKEHIATHSRTSLKAVTPASCVKCHDSENSENFNYEIFWPRIKH